MADAPPSKTNVSPERGRVTFEAEGNEGGRYHSRVLHVPSASSGLTLGRGYDMKSKSSATIATDLIKAGVDPENARKLSEAAGLSGEAAKKFIQDQGMNGFEISEMAQKNLFDITYQSEAGDAKRICEKSDTRALFGACEWEKLAPEIQDMVVDLKYRGDYTPAARLKIQKLVASNDLEGLAQALSDASNWRNVPKDRFERRRTYIQAAVAEKRKQEKLKPK